MANSRKSTRNTQKKSTNPGTRRDKSKADKLISSSTNDPSWYAADPALLRDAASIPFSWALGTPVDYNNKFRVNEALPGICALSVVPSVGLATDADAPINVASTALYSYVRHANSGHSNYDSPDLMLYCTAMANVYSFINYVQRLYGLTTMYSQRNRYMPRYLVEAQDVDFDDLASNLANFRYWINVFVSKASSLAVPATMSYFTRLAFLFQNVYCEGESVKDQLYLVKPKGFYEFDTNTEKSYAGKLLFRELKSVRSNGKLSLAEIRAYGDELLNAVLLDEDMNIMSGDILKAYGESGIIKLVSMPEIYPIVPVYDELFLTQIKNAIIPTVDLSSLDITQGEAQGFLSYIPMLSERRPGQTSENHPSYRGAEENMLLENRVLTVDAADPTPEIVIEATRFMVGANLLASDTAGNMWILCGSELPVGLQYYTIINGALFGFDAYTVMAENICEKGYIVDVLDTVSKFKYAPRMQWWNNLVHNYSDFTNANPNMDGEIFSVDNYAVLSAMDVYKLHETATMNMLAVPSIAKVNKI